MRPPVSPSSKNTQLREQAKNSLFERQLSQIELQNVLERLIMEGRERDKVLDEIASGLVGIQTQFSLFCRVLLDNGAIKQEEVDAVMVKFRLAAGVGALLSRLGMMAASHANNTIPMREHVVSHEDTVIFGG